MREGDHLLREGKRKEAKKVYLNFCRLSPNDGRPFVALGRMALEEENYTEGADYLEKAYRLTPGDASVLSNLGRAYLGAGLPDKALRAFDRIIENDPLNYFALSGKARAQVMMEMYDEAEGTIKYTINAVGKRPEILILSSSIHEKQGRLDIAEKELCQAVDISSGKDENRKVLAGFLMRRKKFDRARSILAKLAKKNPGDRDLLIMIGDLEMEAGIFSASEDAYRKAAEMVPDDIDNHMNLGNLFFVQEDYNTALSEYRSAARLDPEAPFAFGGIGDCLMETGKFGEAEAAYKKAVSLNKDSEEDYISLGDLYLKQGIFQKALSAYEKAETINPTGEVLYALARLEARKGKRNSALDYLQEALEKNPDLLESAACEPYFDTLSKEVRFKQMVGPWKSGKTPEFRYPR